MLPNVEGSCVSVGTGSLLSRCQDLMDRKEHEKLNESWERAFYAGFSGGLVPDLRDEKYLGLELASWDALTDAFPLQFLFQGAQLIRKQFLHMDEKGVAILPHLPSQVYCGRLLNAHLGSWGHLSVEWSKKKVRQVVFHCHRSGDLPFLFADVSTSYRLCVDGPDFQDRKGRRVGVNATLSVEKGRCYFFDRFES